MFERISGKESIIIWKISNMLVKAEPLFHAKIIPYEPPAPNKNKPKKKMELINLIKQEGRITEEL